MNAAIVGTSVPEQLIGTVFDALQDIDSTINCLIGRRASEEGTPPHAVVAIPLGSPEIGMTTIKPGGVWPHDAGAVQGRQLMTRKFRIEWRCHDGPSNAQARAAGTKPDFTNAEALFLNTIVQIRLATDPSGTPFHNAVSFSDEEWIDQQEGSDGFERSGTVIRFVSTMILPVYESLPTLVPLGSPSFVTTVKMNNDTADQVTIQEG